MDDVLDCPVGAAAVEQDNRKILNIGSGVEIYMNELIVEIEQALNRKAHRVRNAENPGGVGRLAAERSQAAALLDFQAKINLGYGLGRMILQDNRFNINNF